MRRAVITGMGCVCALGDNVASSWQSLVDGRDGARSIRVNIEGDDSDGITVVAAPASDSGLADLNAAFGRRKLVGVDRFSNLAAAAALEALRQANLVDHGALVNAAIVYGNASGGNNAIEAGYQRLFRAGLGDVHPMTIPRTMNSAAASHLSMLFRIRGHCISVSSACASSAHAISEAMHLVRSGRADVVVAGGSDASLTFGLMHCWRDIQAMSEDVCRPFSVDRRGTIIGEGAATVIVEAEEHAIKRGAEILCVLAGSGSTSDAGHITQPDSESAARAIVAAMADAAVEADEPVLISAHGTGTVLNDRSEARALHSAFGASLSNSRVIATKSAHGHMLGATAAMELIVGIQALKAGIAPPILGYLGPDDDCDLPLVLSPERIEFSTLVSSSFAFGGLNCVLVAQLPESVRRSRHTSSVSTMTSAPT